MKKQELKQLLNQEKFKPWKKLGQNFLIQEGVIQTIVQKIKEYPPPFVEIGPGLGALTEHFKKEELFLIEKDKKLAHFWKDKGWKVTCEDALKLKPMQFPKEFVLFGNLPYEIASSLIIKTSVEPILTETMVFMIQKEVAERVRARENSSNYGLLSVIAQVFWKVSPVVFVSRESFYPKPKVDGMVLQFQRLQNSKIQNPPLFLNFVKKCFQFKRKMLFKKLPTDSLSAKKGLEKLGISASCRAEDLSFKQFIQLYSLFYSKKP